MIGAMSSEVLISASILSADFSNLGQAIQEAEAAGADWLHVDVMDGHFVPNLSMGPAHVEMCARVSELPVDVHLMIENPEAFIPDFIQAGASSITVHAEATPHINRALQMIQSAGLLAGVALNPGTAVQAFDPVLNMADLFLLMTVNPGFAGQQFIEAVLPKVVETRTRLDLIESNAYLQVDGGIDRETAGPAIAAGANVLAVASAIFRHEAGVEAGIRELRNSADGSS